MSVIFRTILNTGKSFSFNSTLSSCKCVFARKLSDTPRKFISFDEVMAQRRAEARRSLVVQVNSESSFNELYGYCSKYSDIKGIHHYNNSSGEHFMLIEFMTEDNLKDVLSTCSAHQKDVEVMAIQSPFLWFRAVQGKKSTFKVPDDVALVTKGATVNVNEDVLFDELSKCGSVSDQIQLLYDRTVLNDVGVRLRFMVARQLEVILGSLYSNVAVRPFGSSVNGFGRMGCDLDLVVTNVVADQMAFPSRRLVFHEKKCPPGRSPWQRHLELAAELLELRVPGARRVQRIVHARVPIVKYQHEFADCECDLAHTNMSGVYMSELLWQYGTLDARVRPLAFAVRRWAQCVGLTSQHPGRWITNFPLTLMVLFFLQQRTRTGAVLPRHRTLVQMAGKEDIRIAEDNLNCTFLRDLNRLPADTYSQNKDDLETLLLQFFEFYSQFDFQDKAISLNEGVAIRKPNQLPLYIVNPLEPSLNVSRNVSFEECERIRMEVRNAAWQLESKDDKSDDWGLPSLIERKTSRGLKKLLRVGNSHRLVSVRDLFKDDEDSKELKSQIESAKDKAGKGSEVDRKSEVQDRKSEVHNGKREVEDRKSEVHNGMREVHNGKRGVQDEEKFKNTSVSNAIFRIRRQKWT